MGWLHIYINTSRPGSVPNTKEEEGSYNMGASPPQKFKSSKEKPLLSFATTTGVLYEKKNLTPFFYCHKITVNRLTVNRLTS